MTARPDGISLVDSVGRSLLPTRLATTALDLTEPWEEQRYTDVPPDAIFGTNEGRLLAEGWNPPRPDIHGVIRRREALRLTIRRLAARSADPGRIATAINHSDPAEIEDAITSVGIEMWLSANCGAPDSNLSIWSYQLERQYRELMHLHRPSVLKSLVGRESPAAARLRSDLGVMDGWVTVAELGIPEYTIYR